MKVNVINVDKFVEINNLQPVSDPVLLERDRTPTVDGLFSYEIFGRPGSSSRQTTFAYIDLKGHYFNPLVYKTLKRIDRKFETCILGLKNYKINELGELVEDETGTNGLRFIYNNWNKIKFKKNDSRERSQRIDMITGLSKNEIFMSKQIVIPPHYRDINLSGAATGKIGHDVVNDKYAKLIRLIQTSSTTDEDISGFDFLGNMTRVNIQTLIVEIYDYFMGFIKGKDGLFRSSVMGKSIDYGARLVISSPIFDAKKYEDMKVSFEYSGVPLVQVTTLFYPFIIKYVEDWFSKNVLTKTTIPSVDKNTGDIKQYVLKDNDKKYSQEKLTKYIKKFIKSPSERFEQIKVYTESNGELPLLISYRELDDNNNEKRKVTRPMTWTDLLYQACEYVVRDKHVYITRYPLEDYMCTYPSKIQVMTIFKTKRVVLENSPTEHIYKYYPDIDVNMDKGDISGIFIDTLQVFNGILKAIGGD